jgi:hypothetical protein
VCVLHTDILEMSYFNTGRQHRHVSEPRIPEASYVDYLRRDILRLLL